MPFDVNGARQAGYSDDEILSHLAQTQNFDVDGALGAGYSKDEILSHLTGGNDWQGSANLNKPLSQQILDRRAANGESAPKDELARRQAYLDRSPGKQVGDAFVGAVGDVLPVAGGGVGAAVGGPVGAALGGAAGESYRQLLNRATGADKAPATSLDAAKDIAVEGGEQGLIDLLTRGLSKGVGRPLGSGKIADAERVVATAKQAGINPNNITLAEATQSPLLQSEQRYIDKKTLLGNAVARGRATRLGDDMRSATNSALDQVGPKMGPVEVGKGVLESVPVGAAKSAETAGKPFDDLLEAAEASGRSGDMKDVVAAAKQLQADLSKSSGGAPRSGRLSSQAQDLLSDALSFERPPEGYQPITAKGYEGYYAAPGGKVVKAEDVPMTTEMTPAEVRRFRSVVSDVLKDPNAISDAKMVASRLEEASRLADDAALGDPQALAEARAGWREHKKVFGDDAGGLAGKITKNADRPEPADIASSLTRSPSDTADIMKALDLAGASDAKSATQARVLREIVAPKGDVDDADMTAIAKRLKVSDDVIKALDADPDAIAKLQAIGTVGSKARTLAPNYAEYQSPQGFNRILSVLGNVGSTPSLLLSRLPIETKIGILKALEGTSSTVNVGPTLANIVRGVQAGSRLDDRAAKASEDDGSSLLRRPGDPVPRKPNPLLKRRQSNAERE